MSQTSAAGQISGNMFLYERPALLSRDDHGGFGINPSETPFLFCSKVRAIPIVVGEIALAARTYPIVFHEATRMVPLAVVGIVDEVNLFVGENGLWEPEAYVPAYVRRYPFAVASESGGGDRLAIVVDMAYRGLSPNAQTPFFQNGEPTDAMRQMIEFCQGYEADRRFSEQMLNELEKYDLVAAQQAQYTPVGANEPISSANYSGVDEERLNKLPDDKFLELRRNGLLGIIHAQLWSMGNWRLLMERRMRRYSLSQDQILTPLRVS